jgi:hypothetical protein
MRSEYRPDPRARYTLLSSVMVFTERRIRRAVRPSRPTSWSPGPTARSSSARPCGRT